MTTDRTGLLFEADFNSGSTVTAMGFKYSGNPSSMTTVDGERGVELTLDHYGSNSYSYRTEIQPNKLPSPDFTSGMFAKMGGEFWYGLSTYMPSSWKTVDKADTIITQWHAQPDAGNPPVALQTKYVNGEQHYNLIIRSNPSGDGTNGFKYIHQFDLGKIDGDIGAWTDWAWHIKWSPNGDGFLELYKNGEKVVDFDGGTCYVDDAGPYMKIGLYKYDWHSGTDTGPDSRTLYVDNVRVGDETSSYATVVADRGSDTTQSQSEPTGGDSGSDTSGSSGGSSGGSAGGGTTDVVTSGGQGSSDAGGGGQTSSTSGSSGSESTGGGSASQPPAPAASVVATAGNDHLIGDATSEIMSGGEGQDTLSAGYGDDALYGNQGDDQLFGNQGADTVFGGQDADHVYGGQGGDQVFGNMGNDDLYGNMENDALFGGQGDDRLFGGQGDDVLAGNLGADTMAGGLGQDRFVVGTTGTGVDRVLDFTVGQDILDLSAVRATFEAATGQGLTAEHLAFLQSGSETLVQVDADGAGAGGFTTVCILDGITATDLDLGTDVVLTDAGTDPVV